MPVHEEFVRLHRHHRMPHASVAARTCLNFASMVKRGAELHPETVKFWNALENIEALARILRKF